MSRPFYVNAKSKFYLIEDEFNFSRAASLCQAVREKLPLTNDPSGADCFVVIGGDGSMLQAVRHSERCGLPILAINGGTVGKTLVDVVDVDAFIEKLLSGKCHLMQFPIIDVEVTCIDGNKHTFCAFNDIWADRLYARSVRYGMTVRSGGEVPCDLPLGDKYVSGDGILVCTPVGSTGYARMLGEMVLPLNTNTLLVAPMASMIDKRKVHAFAISNDQELVVNFEDVDFRSVRFAVDGVYVDIDSKPLCIQSMTVRMDSRSESAISLVVDDLNGFFKKQADFIAR